MKSVRFEVLIGCFAMLAVSAKGSEASQYSVRTYGETTTLESSVGSATQISTKLVRPISDYLSLYAGAQIELYRQEQTEAQRISPLLGFEVPMGWFKAFAEFRVANERPTLDLESRDPRLGLIGSQSIERRVSGDFKVFNENYFECVAIPRWANDPVLGGASRGGLRWGLSRVSALDTFLEAYARESSQISLGRSVLDGRFGLRWVMNGGGWGTRVTAYRRIVALREAPDVSWVGQLAFGGEF